MLTATVYRTVCGHSAVEAEKDGNGIDCRLIRDSTGMLMDQNC
jgi:hypothetical protein